MVQRVNAIWNRFLHPTIVLSTRKTNLLHRISRVMFFSPNFSPVVFQFHFLILHVILVQYLGQIRRRFVSFEYILHYLSLLVLNVPTRCFLFLFVIMFFLVPESRYRSSVCSKVGNGRDGSWLSSSKVLGMAKILVLTCRMNIYLGWECVFIWLGRYIVDYSSSSSPLSSSNIAKDKKRRSKRFSPIKERSTSAIKILRRLASFSW